MCDGGFSELQLVFAFELFFGGIEASDDCGISEDTDLHVGRNRRGNHILPSSLLQ